MFYRNEKPPTFVEGIAKNLVLPTSFSLPQPEPTFQPLFHTSPDAADADGEMEPQEAGATVPPATGWSIADFLDGAAFVFAVVVILTWGAL